MIKYNKQVLFSVNNIEKTTFTVTSFSGIDAISSPYQFDIELASDDAHIQGEDIVSKKATLLIQREDKYCPYSGIVTSFKYVKTTVDYSVYKVVLRPRLWLFQMNVQSQIFLNKSVPEIVGTVLKNEKFKLSYSMDVSVYPEREYVVQYQESDLNFISRLMEEAGIWYFFKEESVSDIDAVTNETLLITDKKDNFENIDNEEKIVYRSKSGLNTINEEKYRESIHHIEYTETVIPENVVVKNFNYRTPETNLMVDKKINGGLNGTVYTYGGSYKDTNGAEIEADIAASRLALEKVKVDGEGNCAAFRAGIQFDLIDHKRDTLNTTYMIKQVVHQGIAAEFIQDISQSAYENEFSCIQSIVTPFYVPECKTPKPQIPGIMTATIEADGGDYSNIDDKGRYKIRMPFDLSGVEKFNASKYVRLSQPYSGSDYGIHFPSHEGTEMIVAHIDGDPNKPMGLGTIPNANTLSPVKDSNKTNSVIRTAGKNEIVLDDMKGAERIAMYTPHDMSFTADNNETTTVKNNSSRSVGGDASDSISGNCTITVKKDVNESIMQNRNVTIDGTHTETVKGATSIKITEGTYEHRVESGKADCLVQGDLNETYNGKQNTTVDKELNITSSTSCIHLKASTDIVLEVGESRLEMYQDGTINLTGNSIALSAKEILVLNSEKEMEMFGENITSTATKQNNMIGADIQSHASVNNIIKGDVMISLNP